MTDTAHMQRRQMEKDAATADIAAFLNQLMDERRQPYLWERVHLVYALSSCFRGCYGLARTACHGASTPVSQRDPNPRLPNDPIFEKADLTLLQQALQAAINEPVQEFPHLGPIIFR